MKQIPFPRRGGCFIVDDEDLALVSQFRWTLSGGYVREAKESGSRLTLHRFLLGAENGVVVDHINGDPLDNRRKNLRICTTVGNVRNRRIHKNNRSGLKGVYWRNRASPWSAQIMVSGKNLHLGVFATAEEAHAAYIEAAKKHFGEFARTA